MKADNKVLACVDRSHFADTIAGYAVWAAQRLESPLEFLHVIDRHPEIGSGEDHSGAIGIDAQAHVLTEISNRDAERTRAVREQSIDPLVMGAYTHSPWRSLFFGSKTSDLLRSARIPTLLLR